jgi:hypothetical protein
MAMDKDEKEIIVEAGYKLIQKQFEELCQIKDPKTNKIPTQFKIAEAMINQQRNFRDMFGMPDYTPQEVSAKLATYEIYKGRIDILSAMSKKDKHLMKFVKMNLKRALKYLRVGNLDRAINALVAVIEGFRCRNYRFVGFAGMAYSYRTSGACLVLAKMERGK